MFFPIIPRAKHGIEKQHRLGSELKTKVFEPSHDLLIRAGFVRQATSGIFTLLPMGLKVLEKIEKLIDFEMKNCLGQKVFSRSLLGLRDTDLCISVGLDAESLV